MKITFKKLDHSILILVHSYFRIERFRLSTRLFVSFTIYIYLKIFDIYYQKNGNIVGSLSSIFLFRIAGNLITLCWMLVFYLENLGIDLLTGGKRAPSSSKVYFSISLSIVFWMIFTVRLTWHSRLSKYQ